MSRIKLIVAYDGTNYCGWQTQKNGCAVQDVLNDCLYDLLGEQVTTMGASRTDAGVHALGNVAVFDTKSRIPAEKFAYALNARLPEDIRIQQSSLVPDDFHPRFAKTRKTYEYKILNRRFEDPTTRLNTFFCYDIINVHLMCEAASYLVGEHDFLSFSSAGNQTKTTIRTIYELSVNQEDGGIISIKVTGNGFLYNMVRIIAGTLIEIGKGKYSPSHMAEILAEKDRTLAGPTAPAKGLTLLKIEYT